MYRPTTKSTRALKRDKRRVKPKKEVVDLTLPCLAKDNLEKFKNIFIVDLMSFSNKTCSKFLHNLLFNSVKNTDECIVFIILKAKFVPKCRECGIGEKNSPLFLKDRFIKEGGGRCFLECPKEDSSLRYRKELTKYIYNCNQNMIVVSEDKQYGYTIIGSSVPDEETDHYLDQYFDTSNIIYDSKQIISSSKEFREKTLERIEKETIDKIEKWLRKRIENEQDRVNLPKKRGAFIKTISPFCKKNVCFTTISSTLAILKDSGDIKLCETCQTVQPNSIQDDNQFYYIFKNLSSQEVSQCDWLMNYIISEYKKLPETNRVPIKISTLNSSSLSEKIEISSNWIIDTLIDRNIIKLVVLIQQL
ncbi:hypothetical protein CYY_002687 [Polysphondylium violaceum]|uniref:Uncharacterized protein n=1 Tax=Polysphondylium violaceum TaxID=133409 RepID=A0A8J4PZT8_9MYCE|nr:hypothetical protein CYY_002687 [Polysphondylium violaceum]